MLTVEEREGKPKAVIQKALVDLKGKAFAEFAAKRVSWRLKDQYRQTGPIQYFGPLYVTDSIPRTLKLLRGS
jgi:pyrophosphate--fructose-6-phosphate 1-phosphotransferase